MLQKVPIVIGAKKNPFDRDRVLEMESWFGHIKNN
jgi:hypothetical protein